MKRLFFALILVAGTLAVTNTNAQPFFRGHVGFGFPHPHVFFAPRPAIVYPPAPYYSGVAVAPPVPYYGADYGYGGGYRHYAPAYYRGRGGYERGGYRHGRRW